MLLFDSMRVPFPQLSGSRRRRRSRARSSCDPLQSGARLRVARSASTARKRGNLCRQNLTSIENRVRRQLPCHTHPPTTRQRGRRRQGQMRELFLAETPACPHACILRHRAPARPTSAGGQRPRAYHPLPRSSGGRAAPPERALEEEEQEAGPLRLT